MALCSKFKDVKICCYKSKLSLGLLSCIIQLNAILHAYSSSFYLFIDFYIYVYVKMDVT